MKNKKKVTYIVLVLVVLAVIIASTSYALITLELTGEKNYSLTIGTLDFEIQNEENAIRLMNAYPMADSVGTTLNPYTFSITNTGTLKEYYKLSLIEDEESMNNCSGCTFLNPSKLRYQLTIDGLHQDIDNLSSETVLDIGELVTGQTKNYELRLWLDSSATIEEENKYYYGKIKVDASQVEFDDKASTLLFREDLLGDNCKTYDDGTDTFLVGQCSNNYVWYSGKLWRVVLKNNETGAVKMLTDNAITAIPYNEANNTNFENSYADQWLNQEFLPTLHDYEDYLVVDSIWDSTLDASSTPTRPNGTTTTTRTVGLLNAYEYYTTYASSTNLATHSTNYLNNGVYWWLITIISSSDVRGVSSLGYLYSANPNFVPELGIRPTINLKPKIVCNSGTGSIDDPYILEEDAKETKNAKIRLSTRYSGEYVTFNSELYRIVGIEEVNGEILTKIIAINQPNALASSVFDTSTSQTPYFSNATIKKYLEDYYQELLISNETAYNMIQPNTTWYLGQVGIGENYKASICKQVKVEVGVNTCDKIIDESRITTANIALPRAGEMFTSQISRIRKNSFWTLTLYTAFATRTIDTHGRLSSSVPSNSVGLHPSMYLKSNVVIASNNTGNGTYEYPYSIELGS